jgi:hypothetical protein
MAAFLSGVKTQAMAMLPQLIQTAEPQIESAIVTAMQKMQPQQKQLLSANLNKLNTVVQRESTNPTLPATVTPSMGGKKRRGRKTRRATKHKKRT